MTNKKSYLGEGVHVQYDGYHIVLTTENGVTTTNTIMLEPEVLNSLDRFTKKLREKSMKKRDSKQG
jgi:hypothetical protein